MATQRIERPSNQRERPLRLVLSSLARFLALVPGHQPRLGRERLAHTYRLFDGHSYRVFRETARPLPDDRRTAIEVVFRLRLIGSARALHWLFQRLCILTTPFWSGFEGFGTKLWMVDPRTRGYAGIYEWGAAGSARTYLDVLLPVLRLVSVRGSVSAELRPDVELDGLLREREITEHAVIAHSGGPPEPRPGHT